MIEPTDEMIADAMQAHNASGAYGPAVAAVLAIVERDYHVGPRIQTRCGATGPDGLTCQRSPDHGTNHAASNGDVLEQW